MYLASLRPKMTFLFLVIMTRIAGMFGQRPTFFRTFMSREVLTSASSFRFSFVVLLDFSFLPLRANSFVFGLIEFVLERRP